MITETIAIDGLNEAAAVLEEEIEKLEARLARLKQARELLSGECEPEAVHRVGDLVKPKDTLMGITKKRNLPGGAVREPRDIDAGTLEVGINDRFEVVVNHPDLKPDENGVGHIVFSPRQARHFANLLLKHADAALLNKDYALDKDKVRPGGVGY